MKLPERQFQTVHAEPGARPLWIGLFGPSGGGKTWSALTLATGIKAVLGGKIEMIDTESGRGKHYAEMFDYEYTSFPPPHGSLDYQAVIQHAVKSNRSKIIIIDSLSHEHEGEGGMIEFHEQEVERMSKGDYQKAEQVKMLAWTKPKAARKQLLRSMLAYGTDTVFILCFRADEQSKPMKSSGNEKTKVVQMGFMPIAGKPFVYEATICALLMPGANGVPTWNPENVGEKMMRKLPEQFKKAFSDDGKPLSEAHGRMLAEWAKGGVGGYHPAILIESDNRSLEERAAALLTALKAAKSVASLDKTWSGEKARTICDHLADEFKGATLDNLNNTYEAQREALRGC